MADRMFVAATQRALPSDQPLPGRPCADCTESKEHRQAILPQTAAQPVCTGGTEAYTQTRADGTTGTYCRPSPLSSLTWWEWLLLPLAAFGGVSDFTGPGAVGVHP